MAKSNTSNSPKSEETPIHKKGLNLFSGEQYPHFPLTSIELAERLNDKIFFNPRAITSFDPIKMAGLLRSIRIDGLLEPIVVAVFTKDGKGEEIDSIILIAGERRYRCLSKAVENNLPCFDSNASVPEVYEENSVVIYTDKFAKVLNHQSDEVEIELFDDNDHLTGKLLKVKSSELRPTVPANTLYAAVSCNVCVDPEEDRMMRLAITENQQSESLTSMEEIIACERLAKFGCKQEQLAYMLAQSITWVSQTLSFREQLPPDCFNALMEGRMRRNVAVDFLSYNYNDRQKLYDTAIKVEEEETAEMIRMHREKQELLEDQAEMYKADLDDAIASGDELKLNKLQKKASSKEKQAQKEADKVNRAKSEKGKIKQGHVNKGASKAGVSTRKAKILLKDEIQTLYVDELEALTDGETIDPLCGECIPGDFVSLVQKTAKSILKGERDPLVVIRSYMVETGQWTISCKGEEMDDCLEEEEITNPYYEEENQEVEDEIDAITRMEL